MKTLFLRAIEADDKAALLREAIRTPVSAQGKTRFVIETDDFAIVPNSPFTYWVRPHLRELFGELPALEMNGRMAKQGLATADDFRFVRAWWGVSQDFVGQR